MPASSFLWDQLKERLQMHWSSPFLFAPSCFCLHANLLSQCVFLGVLASCGCNNMVPPTGWLKATEMYSLAGLGARSPKSMSLDPNQGVDRAVLPPMALVATACRGLWAIAAVSLLLPTACSSVYLCEIPPLPGLYFIKHLS